MLQQLNWCCRCVIALVDSKAGKVMSAIHDVNLYTPASGDRALFSPIACRDNYSHPLTSSASCVGPGRELRLDTVGLGNAELHQSSEHIVHLGAERMRGRAERCISLEHGL